MLAVLAIWIAMGTLEAQDARWTKQDSAMVADIHRHILGEGGCVEDLRMLCKDIGARPGDVAPPSRGRVRTGGRTRACRGGGQGGER